MDNSKTIQASSANQSPILAGRSAIVTGAGSGIGAAIAKALAHAGATVELLDLELTAAQSISEQINCEGGTAQAWQCDVSQGEDVAAVIAAIHQQHPIHILVNNAGIAHVGTATTTSAADLDRLYEVNIKGVYHCLHYTLPLMQSNGGGVVLNLASVAASVSVAERFAYSMSKGAVLTMTYSVAKDFIADNIRCNAISPARVHTPFVDGFVARNYPGHEREKLAELAASQPIGRMARPEEVAALAVFLCSDAAAFITGSNIPVDGGFVTLQR